jgi:molecular chaperone GrpE
MFGKPLGRKKGMANEEVTAAESEQAKDDVLEGVLDDSAAQADETSESAEGEDLVLLLEDARAKADEHWNQLLLAKAETENVRRRAKQDTENAHKYGLEKFALELLPVKDSLEMGLAAVESNGDEAIANLKEGTELTLKMLTSAMEKFGIEALNPMGDTFDPALHQAMTMQESAEHKPNTVIAVMQKGYQLNERLIRPAMVVVSKAVSQNEGGSGDDSKHIDEQA